MDIDDARTLLTTRPALAADGVTSRMIDRATADGTLRRLGRGGYVTGEDWGGMFREDQHLLTVLAALARARDADLVVSHASAAVVHQLPLWGSQPARVHVSGGQHNGVVGRDGALVARHRSSLPDADRTERAGIPVTTLERTVADVLRTATRACALVVTDAALHRRAWDATTRTYDEDAAEVFRAAVAAHLRPGARGVRGARSLLELADGRAESPGESVSRLHLHDLGFARPRLQVPVPSPTGGWYYVDFGLDDLEVWGEFDGEVKYRTFPDAEGRSLEEILRAEKAREDWIRGTTGRRLIRWGSADIRTAASLRTVLARFHVRPH